MPFCIYCNSILGSDRDHVIPKSWTGNPSFAERYVVPCCKQCNGLLGSAPVHTVEERAAYLYERYSHKYSKELQTEDWTPIELKQMSKTMKKFILAKQKERKDINQKLVNLRGLAGEWLSG